MECKGTMEEIKALAEEIYDTFQNNGEYVIRAVMTVFERRGWITKPEWEAAYETLKQMTAGITIHNYIDTMAARIRELEGKEG